MNNRKITSLEIRKKQVNTLICSRNLHILILFALLILNIVGGLFIFDVFEELTNSESLSNFNSFRSTNTVDFNRICNQYITEGFNQDNTVQFGVCITDTLLLTCKEADFASLIDEVNCSEISDNSICGCNLGEYIDLRGVEIPNTCTEIVGSLECNEIDETEDIDLKLLLENSLPPPTPTTSPIEAAFTSVIIAEIDSICLQYHIEGFNVENDIDIQFAVCLDNNAFVTCGGGGEGIISELKEERCSLISEFSFCGCGVGEFIDLRGVSGERTLCTEVGDLSCNLIDNAGVDLELLLDNNIQPIGDFINK